MNWLRSQGWLYLALLLLAGEVGLWIQANRQARRAWAGVDQLTREASQFSRVAPALGETNVRAIQEEVAKAEQALLVWRAAWPVSPDSLASAPPAPPTLETFFEHLTWLDQTRARAAEAQVAIAPTEYFGFALLAHEGPPAGLAALVWRQRQRLNFLLEVLFAARPRAVLAVQREQPHPLIPHVMALQSLESVRAADMADSDYFIPDARLLMRSSGHCTSEVFRLEFTGDTPVLRTLLNRLASGPVPVLVRSVTVEKLTAVAPAQGTMGTTPPPVSGALVTSAPSRFVVVVEWIDPPSPRGKTAA